MKTNLIALFSGLSLLLFSCKTTEKVTASMDGNKDVKEKVERIETILYVSPRHGDCMDGSSDQCLYVKQFSKEEWQPIKSISENFDYIPGYEHRIKVSMNSDYSQIEYIETIIQKDMRHYEPVTALSDIWYLNLFKDQKMEIDPKDAPQLIINLMENYISGRGFCTELMGQIVADNPDHLELRVEAFAEMECEDDMQDNEGYFMDCISNVNTFRVEGDNLFLYVGEHLLLGFKRKY